MSNDPLRRPELAINPDTGIVHRRMSDGTWYPLDVIPDSGAVTDEGLHPYRPAGGETR